MQSVMNNLELEATDGRSVFWGDARSLLKLAMPIIGITMSRMLMGFADFFQVSYLGTSATAAISPSSMLVFAAICFGMGATTSVQTFASQALGRGEPREGPKYVGQVLYLFLFSLPIAASLSYFSDALWHKIGSPPDVMPLQISFCRIAFWSMPLGIACGALESFFNGIQKPAVALRAIIAALVCVVVANYVLIFGHFGFPALGIAGSAIATVIAWGVRFSILATVYFSREFRDQYGTHRGWKFDWPKLRSIISIGGPVALQWVLDIGAWFLFLSVIIQGFGTETLAASNIAIQYMHVAFMPAIGLGIALCSVVGQSIGKGRPDLAIRKTRVALAMAVTYMGFIALFFVAIPKLLIAGISKDAAVITAGVGVLAWAALFQVSDAFCIIYINALRGAGDTRWPAVMLVAICWGIFLMGGFACAQYVPQWKHHGPWLMCTLYITILGGALWWRFVSGAWKRINLFKHDVRNDKNSGFPAVPISEGSEAGMGVAP